MTKASLPCVLLFLFASVVNAADPTGLWVGEYAYPDESRSPVPFSLVVKSQEPSNATGRSIEPNTFAADTEIAVLGAIISLTIKDNGKVDMLKIYDGSGGVTHSVQYQGKFNEKKSRIKGTWDIDGYSGTFAMRRIKSE